MSRANTVAQRALMVQAIGLTIGLVAPRFVAGAMSALVVGVNPHDPLTFLATPLPFGAIALFASDVPGCRRTRIVPLLALRTG